MELLYRIELVGASGQRSVKDERVTFPVTVGRGSQSNLIISAASFPPEAFRLELEGESLNLSALCKSSAVQVNKMVVADRAPLKAGDQIGCAGLTFALSRERDLWLLSEYRVEGGKSSAQDQSLFNLARLDLGKRLPPIKILSVMLALFIAAIFFAFPLLGKLKTSWSSGPLSNKHQMIADKCSSCHQVPFVQVQDKACIACHTMSEHARNLPKLQKAHSDLELRCAQCHMDHNGDHGLALRESSQCTQCHANLKALLPDTSEPAVSSFDNHPQFSVSLAKFLLNSPDQPVITRVNLDDKAALQDPTHLKLNHKLHLKQGLRGENGPTTLYCKDCHALNQDFATIKPLSFEKNCRSCHPLEFDERLPGNQVPHAKPDVVYNYLYAEYAKFLLASQQDRAESGVRGFERFRPGEKAEPEARTEYVKKYVEAESRVAERLLFTRTACQLCHDVSERGEQPDAASTGELSKYSILPPKVPARWMPGSIFEHGAHEEVKCEACHSSVRESETTADVLLPGVGICQSCHADTNHNNKLASDCTTCHSYHDSLEMAPESKREINAILSTLR